MATKKQIEANRLNASRSTGPRSVDGKARSRMNALKSGIDAKSQIIRGEKAANLEALKTEYYGRYRPTDPVQRMLVDTLVDTEWLLRRFRVCEAQLWEQAFTFALRPREEIEIGQSFRGNSDSFARLQRRIDSAHRIFRNTLHELERLQAAETPDSDPDSDPLPDPLPYSDPDPATPPIQTAKRSNGFVPQPSPQSPLDRDNSTS